MYLNNQESLQDEYNYTGSISKYCRQINPLIRSDYDADYLSRQYDIGNENYQGHDVYSYEYHDKYYSTSSIADEQNKLISINWCGIDVINHFRKILSRCLSEY